MKRFATLFVVALLATALVALPANAGTSCHKINLRAVIQNTPDNPGPGGGLTSTAQVRGGGLVQGTTEALAYVSGFTPDPDTLAFVGDITSTTNGRTLTVSVGGELNLESGEFWSSGPVTDPTRKLAGATGELRFEGTQNVTDLELPYAQTTTGEICVDLGGNGMDS